MTDAAATPPPKTAAAGAALAAVFPGDTEMARCCRALDWAATPLGPVDGWPDALRAAVRLVLAHPFPHVLLWGSALVQIYNDGYRARMGDKHPAGLGQPTHACWPEFEALNTPLLARAWAGEPVVLEDARFPVARAGVVEDAWFTLGYSPVRDATGAVAGVLVAVLETTARVRERAREAESRAREARQTFLLRLSDALRADPEAVPDADAVAHRALGMLAEELALDRCYVGVYHLAEDRGEFPHQVGNDRVPPLPAGVRLSDFPDALRIAFDRTLVLDDVAEAPGLTDADRHNLGALGLRALVVATLRAGAGRPLWSIVAVSARPRRWAPGEVALLEDATERTWAAMERARAGATLRRALATAEGARADAEAANRARSDFLATMSHELRTPLNAIQGHVQLLEMELHGPIAAAQRAALGRVQRAQQHLLGLINDVLNYAKLDAGRVAYRVEAVALGPVLDDVGAMLASEFRARGLALTVPPPSAPDAGAPVVRADGEKVRQVLLNLLSNALKFTPAGGAVRVTTEPDPADATRVRVHVRDTGVGIPADQQEAVFAPFVQLSAGRTRTHEGTGLGLAISRDLARGMGGDLTAKSSPGVGSTFTLTLPAAN